MIYLSRLLLDGLARRVQSELAAPYEMHRTLCHAFPGLSKEQWEAARVLFRADEDNGKISLLVQSKIAPDWVHFADKVVGRYLLASPDVREWEPRFEVGQTLRFRLQANPTFSPKNEGRRGQRRGLYREAERLDWLHHRALRHGFELPLAPTTLRKIGEKNLVFRGQNYDELTLDLPVCEVVDLNGGRVQSERNLSHRDRTRRTLGQPMPLEAQGEVGDKPRRAFGSCEFSAARFDGTLRVVDVGKFTEALENGIGAAKGYGYGLLSLARA